MYTGYANWQIVQNTYPVGLHFGTSYLETWQLSPREIALHQKHFHVSITVGKYGLMRKVQFAALFVNGV